MARTPQRQLSSEADHVDEARAEIVDLADGPSGYPTTLTDALARLTQAEDALRAISAGEVDAFVLSDGTSAKRVYTLSTADRPYRIFVEDMREGVATVSSDGVILYANRRMAELLSCPKETIIGSPLAQFVAVGTSAGAALVFGAGPASSFELDLRDANGLVIPALVGTSPLEVDGKHLSCLTFSDLSIQRARETREHEIAVFSQVQAAQVTDLLDAQVVLTQQATHDALTELPNRSVLIDRISQALSHAKRSGRLTAVLFVDLDAFKHVNDTHGHTFGDAMLRRASRQMVAALRPMDTVARVGGDEFAVLASEVDSVLHAVQIGTRLITNLQRPPDRIGEGGRIGASIGIAISVDGRGTAETLVNEADVAMYQAKKRGGGRVAVFDDAFARQVGERLAAQRRLQSALDENRVVAYYQPVIDLSTGKAAGCEALARIREHDGTVLSPAAFMDVAEESGLVVRLGAQILNMACLEAQGWQLAAPDTGPSVAVNISSRQLESGDLATEVSEALLHTGLDPSCLHLELTETVIIEPSPETVAQLKAIRELGVEIGLDDFGTGYASLTQLRRLPVTFVKIDRSFVKGLGVDKDDERVVAAVVDLAANLDLRSVAEGVETSEQLDRLRGYGCDQAQGYLFAKPLAPPVDVLAALQSAAW